MTELTPHHIDLIYSATLASFWRKKALRAFLRNCGIAEAFLATWHGDETKRDFLDRVFERLSGSEKGPALLRQMGRALTEQQAFPDLEGWEDSSDKILKASEAIDQLRRYQSDAKEREKQEADRLLAREKFNRDREQAARSQQSLQRLVDRLAALTERIGSQKAGYDFQDWFYDLLDFFDIENRRPYVIGGRQIDGSCTLEGTTYLVELKFTGDQAGATDIDSIKAKIDSKADNTMGLLLSISGFSSVAISEASTPKTPLLLLDYSHVYAVLGGMFDLRTVVSRVRRHASQTGQAFLPVDKFSG